MNRDVIFAIVIMVFVYLILKYKLLPYFAAKKILKDAKNGKTTTDAASQPQSPDIVTQMLLAQSLGHSMTNAQPQPEKPSRKDMYIECRCIASLSMEDLEDAVLAAASDMFVTLRNRGICPNQFEVVSIRDGLLLAYVTYIL